jgi:riboflavin transporter FmnP
MSNPTTAAVTVHASSRIKARNLAVTAMLSTVAFVLMFLDFAIPFLIPSFVKMDVSELPALLAAFSLGPVYGVAVCLIKNLVHLLITTTGGVGELCNFLLGACFVIPAGVIYHQVKSRKGAILGALVGAVVMAVLSIPVNYFISYPFYTSFMPMEAIIGMYQTVLEGLRGVFHFSGLQSLDLITCLTIFNAPFTLVKGLLVAAICFLIYKPLSPILHGKKS